MKEKLTKKQVGIIIIIIIAVVLLLTVFISDSVHQKKLSYGRDGYYKMNVLKDYPGAIKSFEKYLDVMPKENSFYWKVQGIINGKDDQLMRDRVEAALIECKQQ